MGEGETPWGAKNRIGIGWSGRTKSKNRPRTLTKEERLQNRRNKRIGVHQCGVWETEGCLNGRKRAMKTREEELRALKELKELRKEGQEARDGKKKFKVLYGTSRNRALEWNERRRGEQLAEAQNECNAGGRIGK
ncbi:unnamed protein product [Calypogeia fissa]